jgi:hypothetical protein
MMSVQVYPKQTRQMSIGSWISPAFASVPCILILASRLIRSLEMS